MQLTSNTPQTNKMCVCTDTYFGCVDHCSCIGLCIVTASSTAGLVTSDQLQGHKDLQMNTRHIVNAQKMYEEKTVWK